MFKMSFLCSPELGTYIDYWLNDIDPEHRVVKNPMGLSGFWEITIYDISPDSYVKLYEFIQYHKRKGDLL